MPDSHSTDPSILLQAGPILLYDGECGVCSGSIQWILAHERPNHLRFAALQSDLGKRLRAHTNVPENIDSVLWIETKDGQVKARQWSSALVSVLCYIGGPWRLLAGIRIIPRPLRDAAYRLFARHRLKFAPTSCLIPPPETRPRFLSA
jgi:predicted DCC family thiol-disulfide oxidoreductase YuxK